MSPSNPQIIERYIAIDAHKHYVVVGGLNAQMEIVLPLRKKCWPWSEQAPSQRSSHLGLVGDN